MKIVISGGGTGGHIFPAISIANALREIIPDAEILFVGAEGKMEMKRVPAAGYEIIGLPLRGLLRPFWKPGNIRVAINYLYSKWKIKKVLRKFNPQVAVGVGGYASSATLDAAYELGIPCLIQEQNSFAGLTNKKLADKAQKICVAYEGMERFFPAEKIMLTGNPVRQDLTDPSITRETAAATFGLSPSIPTILLVGGSLGARTLNQSVLKNLNAIARHPSSSSGRREATTALTSRRNSHAKESPTISTSPTSSAAWTMPIGLPTSSSAVPVPEASANCACWESPLSWCPAPTWQRTIRHTTPWHSQNGEPPSWYAMPMPSRRSSHWQSRPSAMPPH